ncbi:hypothetical protein ABIE64_001099 [Thalassospira sp. MBR-102]
MSAWQVAAVARPGNKPVGGPWGVSWRGCWRPEVCPGFMVVALAKGPEQAARLWGVWWLVEARDLSGVARSRRGAGRGPDGRLWDPRFVRACSVAGRPVCKKGACPLFSQFPFFECFAKRH